MKTLVLVRHAKAVDSAVDVADFYRSLKLRGINDAIKAGKKILQAKLKPEMVISSPAFRALETAIIFCKETKFPVEEIKIKEFLYDEFDFKSALKMLSEIPDKINTCYVFGHNPDISEWTAYLSNQSYEDMPTCGISVIEIEAESWMHVSKGVGNLKTKIYPEN